MTRDASGGDIYARKMMVGVASVAFAEFIRDKCRDRRQQRFGIGAAGFDLVTGADGRGQHQQAHDAVVACGVVIAAHGGIGVEAFDDLDQLVRGTGVQALDIFDFQDRCRHWDMPPLWLLIMYLMLSFFCVGILFGNMNALAMEPLGNVAGLGSAIVGSLSTLISVLLGTMIGQAYNGTVLPLIAGMGILMGLSIFVVRWADA